MARRSGLLHGLVRAQREAERKRVAQMRMQARFQTQAAKAAERARKDYERAQLADQKERARLYTESRIAQVNLQNEQLDQLIARLATLLKEALSVDTFIDIQTLKQAPEHPIFNPGQLGVAEPAPVPQMFLPPDLTGFQKLLPGAKEKHAQEVARAYEAYQSYAAAHAAREGSRQRSLAEAKVLFDRHVAEMR